MLVRLFVLLPRDEIKDKISERKVCSSPCSVQNWRGDLIYRHGCQITGLLAVEEERTVFSLIAHRSTALCGAVFCHAAGWRGSAHELCCSPLMGKEAKPQSNTSFVFFLLLLVLPLLLVCPSQLN